MRAIVTTEAKRTKWLYRSDGRLMDFKITVAPARG